MATIDVSTKLQMKINDDELSTLATDIAAGVFEELGVDSDDEGLFDDFRYDVVEVNLLGALQRAAKNALAAFPTTASAYEDWFNQA